MNIRKLVCLLCALSGCTLTLSSDPSDDLYSDSEGVAPPRARPIYDEPASLAPVTAGAAAEPTFLPREPEPPRTTQTEDFRDLTLHMTGMDEEVGRFMKIRLASRDNRTVAVGIVHQGIPSADYTFELPNVLRDDTAYTLTFFADTNGDGGYSVPPEDHAWSLPIPASRDDVTLEFEHNRGYVDIERDAPEAARSLVVSFQDMQEYYKHPLDVRVIERESGRLVGRHVRQVPGDTFDLTIGGVIHDGVTYQVDVAVDIDEDGYYDRIIDDSWRVIDTAGSKGLYMTFVPNGPYVDVDF
jgi:hypothetical protein